MTKKENLRVSWHTPGVRVPPVENHWHRGGDSNVAKDPFRAPGSIPSYVCLPPAWSSAAGDCLIPRFLWY
jgi:hypothetical protein